MKGYFIGKNSYVAEVTFNTEQQQLWALIHVNINNDDKRQWAMYYLLTVHSVTVVYSG